MFSPTTEHHTNPLQGSFQPRPWSPDPYHPLPTLSALNSASNRNFNDSRQRREASEDSIEALDLADYAQTLRLREQQPNPLFAQDVFRYSNSERGEDERYPSWPSNNQYPQDLASRSHSNRIFSYEEGSSYGSHPPSLVSRGQTLSSHATHSTPHNIERPLPLLLTTPRTPNYAAPRPNRPRIFAAHHLHSSPRNSGPPSEADISLASIWSHPRYNMSNPSIVRSPPPFDDLDSAIPPSHLPQSHRKPKTIFDPDYVHYDDRYYPNTDPSAISDPVFAPPSSLGINRNTIGNDSTLGLDNGQRGILPWNPSDGGARTILDPATKEQRVKMLERIFGSNENKNKKGKKAGKKKGAGEFEDEDGKPLIGTVDEKGNLVTQGPKKRAATRFLQFVLVLGAGVPAIYAALAFKPDPPAPPAGKPPAFILYILSALTFLLLLYLFVLRPCCCNPRKKDKGMGDNPLLGGMMVLPVPGNQKKENGKRKGKKKGKRNRPGGDGDVQVNLIVDPHVFSHPNGDTSSSGSESDFDFDFGDTKLPGQYDPHADAQKKKKAKSRPRRSVFAGLAMEAEWKRARAWTRKLAFVDAAGMTLWATAFMFVLLGKRCPSGGFEGWCNAYNTSSAAACLLCIAFGVSLFFGVKDLYASKASPRTRI